MSQPAVAREPADLLLVGGGIMSANLAAIARELDPRLSIQVLEAAAEPGREASDGWNNAGTGHAGLCEISYTPDRGSDGGVPIGKAVAIFEKFMHSRQFWAHAVEAGIAGPAQDFIRGVPHICFVWGDADAAFLRDRHAAMRDHHFFRSVDFTTGPSTISAWAPLVMDGRRPGPVAATRSVGGTEVDFGLLARRLLGWLDRQEGCGVATGCRATSIRREGALWRVESIHAGSGERFVHHGRFVFVGAGGGTLRLLQSSGLPEAGGLASFPIGGQWLVCDSPEVTERHAAKVYGTTPPSSPSLGAAHLDVRWLEGTRSLLFGPFASWTTRFLKTTGRWTDLPLSLRAGNVATLLRTAASNRGLVRYLLQQGLQGTERRLRSLRTFYPEARAADWRLVQAGIRVQTIKAADRGRISFGTEVFTSRDHSLAALLGASPGASVSVSIALETITRCLPHLLEGGERRARMRRLIPTFDVRLADPGNAAAFERESRRTDDLLGLAATAAG